MTQEQRREVMNARETLKREGYETVAQFIESAMLELFPPPPPPPSAPLPCPFCGATPTESDNGSVECVNCSGWNSAAGNWNRRAPCPTCAEKRCVGCQLVEPPVPCPVCAHFSGARNLLVTGPGWNMRMTMERPVWAVDGTVVAWVTERRAAPPPCPTCATTNNIAASLTAANLRADKEQKRADAAELARDRLQIENEIRNQMRDEAIATADRAHRQHGPRLGSVWYKEHPKPRQ